MSSEPPAAPRRRTWSAALLAVVVLVAGTALAAFAALAVSRSEQRYAGQVMDRYADNVGTSVANEVDHYGDTLRDLASAAGAQSELRADEFLGMTAGLNTTRLPGATTVSYVIAVPTGRVAATEAQWRALGVPALRLHPYAGGTEHLFIVYQRDWDGRADTSGMDLGRVAEAAEALQAARSTGALAASPAYVLMRDQAMAPAVRQYSVALAAPVLSSADARGFLGWVMMTVRGGDFLTETLRTGSQDMVQVNLSDPAGTVLADISPGRRLTGAHLTRTRTVTVGQSPWQLTIRPTDRLLPATDRRLSMLTFFGGLAGAVLLAALVGVLAGSRTRAMNQVDRATQDLREDIDRRQAVEEMLRQREHELERLALHDPLTGLANRTLFFDRVAQAVRASRRTGRGFAVLYLDLDGFKQVNDQLGHGAGDRVLCDVAARLTECLRESDTIARLGGDEFAVVAERVTDPADATRAAERVVGVLSEPYDLEGRTAPITVSVGVALYQPGQSADELVREADEAMYAAKAAGKSRFVVSRP